MEPFECILCSSVGLLCTLQLTQICDDAGLYVVYYLPLKMVYYSWCQHNWLVITLDFMIMIHYGEEKKKEEKSNNYGDKC